MGNAITLNIFQNLFFYIIIVVPVIQRSGTRQKVQPGIALLIVVVGILGITAGAVGYMVRVIREVDTLMPDHDALPAA